MEKSLWQKLALAEIGIGVQLWLRLQWQTSVEWAPFKGASGSITVENFGLGSCLARHRALNHNIEPSCLEFGYLYHACKRHTASLSTRDDFVQRGNFHER